MARALTRTARQELVQAIRERYRAGPREAKSRILEEFSSISGYHRKSAIRILNGAMCPEDDQRGRSRARVYDEAVRQALIVLWEASDRVCGKRLKALFPVLVSALERNGHLSLDAEIRPKLLAMSASTIDRLLREIRSISGRRRVRRIPTALRKSVPIRTFSDWNEPMPGFMEIDLVAHCGDVAAGSFVHTLTLTDVATGWTECLPLLVRESGLIVEAIDSLRGSLPFRLAALTSTTAVSSSMRPSCDTAPRRASSSRDRGRTIKTTRLGSSRRTRQWSVDLSDITDSKGPAQSRRLRACTAPRACL
jgi:hypothetical protein